MLELTQLWPPSRQRDILSVFSVASSKTRDHFSPTSWSGIAVEELSVKPRVSEAVRPFRVSKLAISS
jgi:hypothetical protein